MTTPLKILFEDNHLLVIDKPALLPTMGVEEGDDSLVNQAKRYLGEKYNKPGKVYLGVVSRLDSFVSGVIVFARTSKSASRLNEQFREREPQKIYLAIVPNLLLMPERGKLENRIAKIEEEHRMRILDDLSPARPGEKSAVLNYRTLGRSGEQRLLEIQLETGRKHQIRVQLAGIGCPILGDLKYDSELSFPVGIALHSLRLKLTHPTLKTVQSFQSAPPAFWRLDRFGYDIED